MRLALQQIAGMIGARAPEEGAEAAAGGYSIDSRTLRPGELFFALRGGCSDGHEFVQAALDGGALAAVVEQGRLAPSARLLEVPDPKAALQKLAAEARRQWGGRIVAITGSNGKTTTKEITSALLATRFRVDKSEGNLNNDLGLPLSLLRMKEASEVGVMELGMNHAGELRELAAIAAPQIGLVTNVNLVHLEFFRSVDEIALAKRELIEGLPADGAAVLNADDERVSRFADFHRSRGPAAPVVSFGVENTADVRAVGIQDLGLKGTRFRLEACGQEFFTPLAGRHNLYNTLAALAVARALGLAPVYLSDAVAGLRPARLRGEILEADGIQIINDCYNSNPRAAEMMLDLLATLVARRRVAVLGEMLELGENSEALHRQVGRKAAQAKLSMLAGVGGAARYLVEEAVGEGFPSSAAWFFQDAAQAGEHLRTVFQPGDAVLFKGSRGVRLEKALQAVIESLESSAVPLTPGQR